VYPTDTVYGLGCDPKNEGALERVFKAKGRGAKPLPVLCDSIESASQLVEFTEVASDLARTHWPGALTIILRLRVELPSAIHQGTNTVGVRVPASPNCVALLRACGGYLVGTSANRSGLPPCRTAQEALHSMGGSVDLILDGGRLRSRESTVVRVVGSQIEVFRQGQVRVMEKPD